ncbi:substrate-binding domain-containing protein [Paenibacillus sp. GCM10027626]|uniref:substrate-binding domain-containing protein n=1 Tax=Paenibacillus sp. GCM10027626 TaxID=3273411 RepID=UPI0036364B95
MIRSSQRIPLYTQIRQYILDQIEQKKWLPGDKIPSENELAERFNVSRITVKNALSKLNEDGLIFRVQGKGSFISPDPLGEPLIYSPEPAKNTKNKGLVAYLMPRLRNSFTARMLDGIESELAKNGYRLIFCKTNDSQEIEKEALQEVIQLGVKGIIIFPVDGETYSEDILRLTLVDFPVVVVDRYLRGIETNCVHADNVEGARVATAHLISLNHRKIGFLSTSYPGTTSLEDRLAGYEKALAEHNIPVEHRLRLTHFAPEPMNAILNEGIADETSKKEIQTFLKENPDITGVFAVNSSVGLTLMEAALELGIRVPEQLSVVFFDNYEFAPWSSIPPTCISQVEYDIGKESVRLLISVMENPKQVRRKIVLPNKLIVRKSTAPCAVNHAPL